MALGLAIVVVVPENPLLQEKKAENRRENRPGRPVRVETVDRMGNEAKQRRAEQGAGGKDQQHRQHTLPTLLENDEDTGPNQDASHRDEAKSQREEQRHRVRLPAPQPAPNTGGHRNTQDRTAVIARIVITA